MKRLKMLKFTTKIDTSATILRWKVRVSRLQWQATAYGNRTLQWPSGS